MKMRAVYVARRAFKKSSTVSYTVGELVDVSDIHPSVLRRLLESQRFIAEVWIADDDASYVPQAKAPAGASMTIKRRGRPPKAMEAQLS